MTNPKDTWTRAHDLALVFVAIAYGTDYSLSDEEMSSIVAALKRWNPEGRDDELNEVVFEAAAIFTEKEASSEISAAITRLKDELSKAERKQALEDVVRIAESDGIVLGTERSFVAVLAAAWDVRARATALLREASQTRGTPEEWTLLHDLSLVYIVVAHSADSVLSEAEIAAMLERLQRWQPNLNEDGLRAIIRRSLSFYSTGLQRADLQLSVSSLKDALPKIQRIAVLDDLTFIAECDGAVSPNERDLIASVAQAFDVEVHLNGRETA
jgi:uncharacterized tellurite resistance protein B-like protein